MHDEVKQDVQEVFTPDEKDWFEAAITQNGGKGLYLQSGDVELYCTYLKVVSRGNHLGCLKVGTPCAVRMRFDPENGRYWGRECIVEPDLTDLYYETTTGVIENWNYGKCAGSARRPCGCTILAVPSTSRGIRTLIDSDVDPYAIVVGSRVQLMLKPSRAAGWCGYIQHIIEEKKS